MVCQTVDKSESNYVEIFVDRCHIKDTTYLFYMHNLIPSLLYWAFSVLHHGVLRMNIIGIVCGGAIILAMWAISRRPVPLSKDRFDGDMREFVGFRTRPVLIPVRWHSRRR